MHWPKVSEKKKVQLEELKMSLKTSPLRYKKSPKSIMSSEPNKDKEYSSIKNHIKAHSDKEDKSLYKKKVLWPENTMKPKPKEKKEG